MKTIARFTRSALDDVGAAFVALIILGGAMGVVIVALLVGTPGGWVVLTLVTLKLLGVW